MAMFSLGPVISNVEGVSLSAEDRHFLQHSALGGIILFERNYQSLQQLKQLIADMRAVRDDLLIVVDQEGGRVQRFQAEFTRLPAAVEYGRRYQQDPQHALAYTEQMAYTMASELLDIGVNLSFAPVLDVDRAGSSVIGERSFSSDPAQVLALGGAYIKGMRRAGMPATGKHFPGHGAVRADSHVELPEDNRDYAEIVAIDLLPFSALAQQLAGIMPAHVLFPKVDNVPAGFSRIWLQDILREKIGFNGVVFSDDLNMHAASSGGPITERAERALRAGCDRILVCNDRARALVVLEHVGDYQNAESAQRINKLGESLS